MSKGQSHFHARHFASDNQSGICPEIAQTMLEANRDHVTSYGADLWTRKAARMIQNLFETPCDVFFVFNGTAANSLAIASGCHSFNSVLCHPFAHIATDECGAPGFFSHGTTLIPVPGKHGKISATAIKRTFAARADVHYPKPAFISLTQSTELGTLYTVAELKDIGRMAKKLGLYLHMDGARFANATAALKVAPRKFTWETGVDVLTLGGTKNGMAFGEALVFFNRDLARNFDFRRKQAGQLASKMRFISAQWVGALKNDLWLKNASHANKMAAKLESALKKIKNVRIGYPRQSNAVFAAMPPALIHSLHRKGWHFYTDVGPDGYARLMCSWDTTPADIEAFVKDLRNP